MTWAVALLVACGSDGSKADHCAGVDCGHGRCVDDGVQATCDCDEGYAPERLTCVDEDLVTDDIDADGVTDDEDVCPAYVDPDQLDSDEDGIGDACESRALTGGPRGTVVATRLRDGNVLFTGIGDRDAWTTEAWTYDATDDGFTRLAADANDAHQMGAAFTLADGRAVFVAGEGDGSGVDTVDVWDAADGWATPLHLAAPTSFVAGARLVDGRFVVVGGLSDGGGVDATQIFDGTGFVAGPPLPAGGAAGGMTSAVQLEDGRVLVSGGLADCDGVTPPTAHVSLWDVDTGEIVPGAHSMGTGRFGHAMALLADGRVVVVGGGSSPCGQKNLEVVDTIEVFDPETEAFSEMATGVDHLLAAVVRLADGSALAAGGMDDAFVSIDRTSRIRTSGRDTGSPFEQPPLLEPRSFIPHGAVLLDDGSVFLGAGRIDEATLDTGAERVFPYYDQVIDRDHDGIVDVLDDCPQDPDPGQGDADRDGTGDVCDV